MTIIKHRLLALVCLLMAFCVSSEVTFKAFDEEAFQQSLTPSVQFSDQPLQFSLMERMQRYGASGVSIAVVHNNKLVFAKGYGTLAVNNKQVVDKQTLFQAASLSKAVTALGVIRLVDSGKISLDKSVNNYLKGWQLKGGQTVTVRELLSHTAGVNNASYPAFGQQEIMPSLMETLIGADGSKVESIQVTQNKGQYHYSGGGYVVLQKVIEDVTGSSFAEYMHSNVLAKFGANHSHFLQLKQESKPNRQNIARGHGFSTQVYPNGWFTYPQSAPAGLWSTPSDLANLLIAYMNEYQGKNIGLISTALAKELAVAVDANMGLGFGSHGDDIDLHIDHAGWSKGYRAYMTAFPERGDAVVIMANSNSSNRLIEEMMRGLSKQFSWNAYKSSNYNLAHWSKEKLEKFIGAYTIQPAGFSVEFTVINDYLQMTTPRGTSHVLYPISANQLVMIEDNVIVSINEQTNTLSFWGMTANKQ